MRFPIQWLTILFFVAAPASSFAEGSPKKSALDKATFEAYIRHLFVWGPQVHVQVSDPSPSELPGFHEVTVSASTGNFKFERIFYVSRDGQKILQGAVYDVNENPFQSEIAKLKTDSQPSLGTSGADVVLVVFSDFQCPYCKDEAKMLRQNLISTYPKQVRLYFKDFPLEQIHSWAKMAAIAGRCIFRQNPGAFWAYHDWVFDHQSEIALDNLKAKVLEFAQAKEIDVLMLGRCLEIQGTEAEVNRSIAEGKALQIKSTPTLFVNGRRLATKVSWPQLRAIIDYEIEYQKTANNAGDSACCEVKLASPFSK